jgi:hypothetical protein
MAQRRAALGNREHRPPKDRRQPKVASREPLPQRGVPHTSRTQFPEAQWAAPNHQEPLPLDPKVIETDGD